MNREGDKMMWGRGVILVVFLAVLNISFPFHLAEVTAEIPNNPNQETWVTDGPVYAITTAGNTVYIGGEFNYVGPRTENGVLISASTGAAMTPYLRIDGLVRTVVSDNSGGWYIGGLFTRVGGIDRKRVAHILSDGTLDPSWNPGADGEVLALAVSGGTVYVGGRFANIGGEARNEIAAIDAVTGVATSWNPGESMIVSLHSVFALAVGGGVVYVGGEFTSIGGQARKNIAAIDVVTGAATSWNPSATGSNLVPCVVNTLAVSGGVVYAGGRFTSIGGQPRSNIAAIDMVTGVPTSWNPGTNGIVCALSVNGGVVYAGGIFTNVGGQARNNIAAIDVATGAATSWNPDATGSDLYSGVYTVTVSEGIVYAGGAFTNIGGQTRNHVAAIDVATGLPTSWNPDSDGNVYALAVSEGEVFAGGYFTSIGRQARNCIAAIDAVTGTATSWNPGPCGGAFFPRVNALVVSEGVVYAGGTFSSIGGQVRNNIAAIDAVTGTVTLWNPDANSAVGTLAVNGGIVFAGGWFTSISGQARNFIAAIDASTGLVTSWSPNARGDLHHAGVYALSLSGGVIYAGGVFNEIGGQLRNNIAALDLVTGEATVWNPDINGDVRVLAVSEGVVYAGGYFTSVGGQPRRSIAAIDLLTESATHWNANADLSVDALLVSGGVVLAGGGFTAIGGQARNHIAAIDAVTGSVTSWNPGAYGGVNAIAVGGGAVYIGGSFTYIGRESQTYFAQFRTVSMDVPSEHWAHDYIIELYDTGITGGCSSNSPLYCPEDHITRGQMAVFIEAALGNQPNSCAGRFDDVPVGHPFCGFIELLAEDGITGGCSATNFCPDDPVTRGQMGVFIEAALGHSVGACADRFADVPSTDSFCGFIERMADDGITGGCGGGNFCPNDPVTRGQMAVFLVAAPPPLNP